MAASGRLPGHRARASWSRRFRYSSMRMAKKTRRQQQQQRRRAAAVTPPSVTAVPATDGTAGVDDDPMAVAGSDGGAGVDEDVVAAGSVLDGPRPPSAGAVEVGHRRIGRVDAATAQGRRGRPSAHTGNAAAQFEPLDPEDAAIPFDRVPYVPSDLRRVAAIALLMLAIILVAAVIVTNVVK